MRTCSGPLPARLPIHLHEVRHPYGPSPAALEALHHPPRKSQEALAIALRSRLAEVFRAPSSAIHFLGGRDESLKSVANAVAGPFIVFPPSNMASRVAEWWPQRTQNSVTRGIGAGSGLTLEGVVDLPSDGVALVDSPSDPLGTLLGMADAVRLARACRFLIVDERCAEFCGRSLLTLALEFDNVATVRTFDLWAGLEGVPFAWTLISPQARLDGDPSPVLPEGEVSAAILATLDDLDNVNGTLKILRDERSRLYRQLRKLSLFEPVPSHGLFLTARVTIVERDDIVEALRNHGVIVHAPSQVGLERYIRFGIGSRSEMEHLSRALHALAPTFLA